MLKQPLIPKINLVDYDILSCCWILLNIFAGKGKKIRKLILTSHSSSSASYACCCSLLGFFQIIYIAYPHPSPGSFSYRVILTETGWRETDSNNLECEWLTSILCAQLLRSTVPNYNFHQGIVAMQTRSRIHENILLNYNLFKN